MPLCDTSQRCSTSWPPKQNSARERLIGIAGFVAPPAADGIVEIGYAIVREYQRRGFATEAVHALLAAAFADSRVTAVTATTFPDLASSIGVLVKRLWIVWLPKSTLRGAIVKICANECH
jgi:RimJ/RimL family protein N-acetyltransferase